MSLGYPHFELPDEDHGILLQVDLGGADYFIAPITNIWGTTNTITHRQGCLNNQQALANPDGTYTFVLSLRDPGIHNWLDPSDMAEGILTLRWAEFADGRPADTLGVQSVLLPLSELDPPQAMQLTPEERREACERRAASYSWRLAENVS